jgi:chloramphenicol 3-O phosphotransferase
MLPNNTEGGTVQPGQIIILNGAPRSGKSSIVAAIDGVWMNLGVDGFQRMTPAHLQPGIGLRPGGERPDLEPHIVVLYAAMYEAIAAHSRLGLNVVVDVGHHDSYSQPRGILPACARRLQDLPVLIVGVRCSLDAILARRQATGYPSTDATTGEVLAPILRWQTAVHEPGVYDLEVDTSVQPPSECAAAIHEYLVHGPPPTACRHLAATVESIAANKETGLQP